ncbi:hypothetical protein GWI34_17540 [Actinomadura sp. DSM 109109]|nr:hypothetical protein [Actinomadura lepetitiana]
MHVGTRLGVVLVAAVVAGGAFGAGAVAGAAPPPVPGQDGSAAVRPQEEEGRGPGAIEVGPEGAAAAMNRLVAKDERRVRLCDGVVLPADGLNVRSGPGLGFRRIGVLARGSRVRTDWDAVQRRDGYLWVPMSPGHWIADYKLGADDGGVHGKWYVNYSNC